ncbi:peptidoglycan-binding protein [Asticcacaulis sp. YBE204]|uniref:peptidoglycan-binding domain-containing protein n=1 Tax=Asticcacaulis sp. YBE204 TaxID=1282363 RepID=UPI0003C40F1B|nr:peptidoglycan-binding domain-containing protein [Asticcacaulis sp. YBE204]ESQ76500.1 hypothetical protein AEYBE204_19085 [Asticcacaulis sp. YBE204]
MNGFKLKAGVSVLALAVLACGMTAQAGEKKTVKPVGEVLNEQPSSYGKSGAQGVYFSQSDVKTKNLPELKARDKAKEKDCPEGSVGSQNPDLPAYIVKDAKPNQCFTRLLKAPVFETYADKVLVAEARTETRTIPEEWRWAERKVVVTPERVERKVIPAVTRTVVEEKVIQEAGWREETVPAVYEKRVEQVVVRPARQEWVRSEGVATGAALVTPGDHQPVRYRADGKLTWPGKEPVLVQADASTTEYLQKGSAQTVWCLKEVPAEYKAMERQVEVRPATVNRVRTPAKIKKIERLVIDREEQVVEKVVPATYRVEKVKEVITPARTETYTVPAVYKHVDKTRASKAPEPVWREIICDKNTSPAKMKEIQIALKREGYDPGPIDGSMGTKTVAAMQKFQADKGLPQGQMSVEAAEALGVRIH